MKPSVLHSYRKRLISGPWCLEGREAGALRGAVVIPACAERESLPQTLACLAANPQKTLKDWLVIVVINQPPDAAPADREENCATLDWLRTGGAHNIPNLCWVDAVSEEHQLPVRDAGVGLARKVGFDLALNRLQNERSILASLDADTLVEANYLQTLTEHFARTTAGGTTLPFAHQAGESCEQQQAIDRYELYLRHYVFGLQLAGSPYAYHSIGSALACRVSAYLAAGGMNRRKAGEDFYFLQQLTKTGGMHSLRGTCVYPSARSSHRVPFGTGEKVARLLRGEDAVHFYPQSCFASLQQLLQVMNQSSGNDGNQILQQLTESSPETVDFLRAEGFVDVWSKLTGQHRTPDSLHKAFHGWFDALKTWRMIRHLSLARPAPDNDQSVRDLLAWSRQETTGSQATLLARLRLHQNTLPTGATSTSNCAMLSLKQAREPAQEPNHD